MVKRFSFNPFGPLASQSSPAVVRPSHQADWLEPPAVVNAGRFSARVFLSEINKTKINFWWLALLLGLLILLGRVLYLQVFLSPQLKAVADGNRIRIQEIKADRGVIYDRWGQQLVKNIPSFSLAVVPVDLPANKNQRQEIIGRLASIAAKPAAEIEQLIEAQFFYSYQPLVLKDNLDLDQAMMTEIESRRSPGVILKIDSSREYLVSTSTPSLSHLLGYLGKINENERADLLAAGYAYDDFIGKAGLEFQYEALLRGQKGKQQAEVDATGNAKEVLAYQPPGPGKNLILTIDAELQTQAEKSLRRVLGQYHKNRGAVVVLAPQSGAVLALVSWPAFDNNLFAHGISPDDFNALITNANQPLFSRAISGEYPSGSTFKLIMAAAALQEGIITRNTSVNSVGGLQVSRWFFPDWKAVGHGWTNVSKALAESVNTFFYMIGGGYNQFAGLGVERIKNYAERFGLNQKLGIDLPQEATGFVPSEKWKVAAKGEQWYIGDTYHLAIGQGDILVTPLQVAVWTAFFANGGKIYQPHLVQEVVNEQLAPVSQVPAKILAQDFIDPENIEIVRQGLRQAVLTGSAQGLAGLPLAVAAKTGTAEWASNKLPHAWITAFGPYNQPEIVVTVLVEEGGEGSTVALPVVADIFWWWAAHR